MEEMPVATINLAAYGKLLAKIHPRVIKTDEENERAIAELEKLDSLGRPMTPEEHEIAELLTTLITQFEEKHYPDEQLAPDEMLRQLMGQRQLRQVDLIPIFGASSTASDAVNGKRAISKAQAKKLAEFFRVPADSFL